MPRQAPSRCTQHCGRLATHHGRCDHHQRKAWENTSARNQALDPNKWTKARAAHLALEPACRICNTADDLTVDHITEIVDGGAHYDQQNLQTLCRQHHEEKTAHQKFLRSQK